VAAYIPPPGANWKLRQNVCGRLRELPNRSRASKKVHSAVLFVNVSPSSNGVGEGVGTSG
jgi:hypothetical protein